MVRGMTSRDSAGAVRAQTSEVVPSSPSDQSPRVGVVLAAGMSSRLESVTGGGSKALVHLGGLSLIERAVRTLLAAGIEHVTVVVGHHAGTVSTVASRFNSKKVSTVYANDWELGNGASLAAARQSVEGEDLFALITTDHVFGSEVLEALLHVGKPAVLVDLTPDEAAWSEGTRVRIHEQRALDFGKKLANPAIDCGAFVLPPEIFECQRLAAESGDHSLAGAVTRLARMLPVRAVAMPANSWWMDVDTPEDLKRARFLLRRSLTKRSDGYVSRFLNRPVSSRVSMSIASLRLSPNLLSLISFIVACAGAWWVWRDQAIAGALLIQAGSVLDGVDGEIARLSVRTSPKGALLDGVLDRISDSAILAALGSFGAPLGLTVAAVTGALLSMASKDRLTAVGLKAPTLPTDRISGRDTRLLIAALGAAIGFQAIALWIVTVTSFAALIVRMLLARSGTRL